MGNITIIQDNQEKEPCNFNFYDGCEAQVIQHLATGDYTALGYEDIIIVERKRSTGELATNLGKYYERFRAEFERMEKVRFRYLVCEFPMDHLLIYPRNSGVPRHLWKKLRISGKFLYKRLSELCTEFGVEPFFCATKEEAEKTIFHLIYNAVQTIEQEKT